MEKSLSRPEQIRVVLRKHFGVILTRAQIIAECAKDHWNLEDKYFSMALSRMAANGEVDTYQLLGKRGYCLNYFYNVGRLCKNGRPLPHKKTL
jgi:hypothetical protein